MKRILLAVLAIAALPLAAQASDLDYTFVQAGYTYAHSDSGGNTHTWLGDGQAALGQNFYVFGGGGRSDVDGTDVRVDAWDLGGGFHTGISANTDFVADAGFSQGSIQGRSGNTNTWSGDVGVRSALAPQFEGWVTAGYSHGDFENGNVDVSGKGQFNGTVGAQYKFNKNFGLVGQVKVADHGQSVFFGPRVSF